MAEKNVKFLFGRKVSDDIYKKDGPKVFKHKGKRLLGKKNPKNTVNLAKTMMKY